jgi:hypothetical protein
MATALTAGRRCSRRRLSVGGGAASVSMSRWRPAPVRLLLGHVRRLPCPAPRVLVTPRRRRTGGGAAHQPPPPLHLFFHLPPSSSPSAARLWKVGKTPMWVGGGGRLLLALLPLLLKPRRRQDRAKSRGCPGLDRPGGRGGVACPFLCDLGHRGMARGQKGPSLPRPGSIRARARPTPRRACRWATRPCPAPRAGVVRQAARKGAARCAGGVGKEIRVLTPGTHVTELEKKGAARFRWADRGHGLGRLG